MKYEAGGQYGETKSLRRKIISPTMSRVQVNEREAF